MRPTSSSRWRISTGRSSSTARFSRATVGEPLLASARLRTRRRAAVCVALVLRLLAARGHVAGILELADRAITLVLEVLLRELLHAALGTNHELVVLLPVRKLVVGPGRHRDFA